METATDRGKKRHAWLALVLGVVSLGLGFGYLGRWRTALFVGLGAVAVLIGLMQVIGGWRFGFQTVIVMAAVIYIAGVIAPAILAVRGRHIPRSQVPPFWAYPAFVVLMAAVAFAVGRLDEQTLFYKAYHIPSGSMAPSVMAGDYVVAKLHRSAAAKETVEPGSIIIFWNEEGAGEPSSRVEYVKRVVGVGGQTVHFENGVVFVDGTPLPRRRQGRFDPADSAAPAGDIYLETAAGGSYPTLDVTPGDGPLDNVGPYEIPDGHYFVLGDNRDLSQDSRITSRIGYIAAEDVIGEARYVAFSKTDLRRFGLKL